MSRTESEGAWARRARPLLGTLVEVGLPTEDAACGLADEAFTAIAEVQACLSRFDPASDVARFACMPAPARMGVRRATAEVLSVARELLDVSEGIFDITLGSGPGDWRLEGDVLHKSRDGVCFDLGGIGKGYAVDHAVRALSAAGCAAGWVNAGGDLRVFGAIDLPVMLRDEEGGDARLFAHLGECAFATSCYGPASRSRGLDARSLSTVRAHVSVAAPLCLWADALTKVVAVTKQVAHPLLDHYRARAWLHEEER